MFVHHLAVHEFQQRGVFGTLSNTCDGAVLRLIFNVRQVRLSSIYQMYCPSYVDGRSFTSVCYSTFLCIYCLVAIGQGICLMLKLRQSNQLKCRVSAICMM